MTSPRHALLRPLMGAGSCVLGGRGGYHSVRADVDLSVIAMATTHCGHLDPLSPTAPPPRNPPWMRRCLRGWRLRQPTCALSSPPSCPRPAASVAIPLPQGRVHALPSFSQEEQIKCRVHTTLPFWCSGIYLYAYDVLSFPANEDPDDEVGHQNTSASLISSV